MIITHIRKNFNLNFSKSHNLEKIFNELYASVVASLDLDDLVCDKCKGSAWYFHGYYTKTIIVHSRNISVKITRIICSICGKTHAILIEPMIPFLSVLYDDLINVVLFNAALFESSFCAYLKKKFSSCDHDFLSIVEKIREIYLFWYFPHNEYISFRWFGLLCNCNQRKEVKNYVFII